MTIVPASRAIGMILSSKSSSGSILGLNDISSRSLFGAESPAPAPGHRRYGRDATYLSAAARSGKHSYLPGSRRRDGQSGDALFDRQGQRGDAAPRDQGGLPRQAAHSAAPCGHDLEI